MAHRHTLLAATLMVSLVALPGHADHLAGAQPMFDPCYAAHQFAISLTGGRRPVIEGVVDLPEGTELSAYVYKPLLPDARQRIAQGVPGCDTLDDCVPATAWAVVKNGHFSLGPFSFGDASFRPGLYPVEIDIIEARTRFICSGYFSKVQIE